jgi:hypothetical protein
MRESAPLKSSALIEKTSQSVFATAVALRACSVITAISPITSPAPAVSSGRPPAVRATRPPEMKYMRPAAPREKNPPEATFWSSSKSVAPWAMRSARPKARNTLPATTGS